MIPLKGIWQDSRLSKQPQDFAYKVLNGVKNKQGSWLNENGYTEFSSVFNAKGLTPINITNAKDGKKVVFSVTSTNQSEIGILNSNGTYTEKLVAALGFDDDYPIDAEIQYNFKDELIVAFTDGLNSPKIINLDDIPAPFDINDIQLFVRYKQPKVTSNVEDSGGSLPVAAIYPIFKYKKLDGTQSPWVSVSNPVFITDSTLSEPSSLYEGSPSGRLTGKLITLSLTQVDISYDILVVGMVTKIDGVLSAKSVKEVPISGTSLSTTLTGGETFVDIDLKEVLTSSADYNTIKHLTQVEGVLYGAEVTEREPFNFQRYANLITLRWRSTLITPRNLSESFKVHAQNGQMKGFAHEEVIAPYIRLKLVGRGWSEAFPLIGRNAVGNEAALNTSLVGGDSSLAVDISVSANSRYFQMRDTSSSDGTFGYWQNEDEVYPNTDDFNSTSLGGRDLRGTKVKWFRFPSIRKMKETTYAANPLYGKSQLDILGIEITSFPSLPPEISSQIEGYEICYAKRSPANSTVAGQSLVLLNSYRNILTADNSLYWTGGNWRNREIGDGNRNGKKDTNEAMYPNSQSLRFHSFDLLLNKPALTPSYISNQIKLTRTTPFNIEDGPKTWAFELDYISNGVVSAVPTNDRYKKISNFKYVPANVVTTELNNFIGEECATATIEGTGLALTTGDNGMNLNDNQQALNFEQTYLASIMNYRSNMYNSFYSQQLVSTGKYFLIGDALTTIYGGDVFIGEFGFVTYAARIVSDAHYFSNEFNSEKVAAVRSFLQESINNVSLRHSLDSNPSTKYYPKEPIPAHAPWIVDTNRHTNPNVIEYNRDYTSVNDLNSIVPFNPFLEFLNGDPYKIVRSKLPNAEERVSSWGTFLTNDYYIIPRNRGRITNIQGIGDTLYINTKTSLFLTRGNEKLATNAFEVVLGSGDIFERAPEEVVFDANGYTGCQHKYSCRLTPAGYSFLDAEKKKWFIVNGKQVSLLNTGLENFFLEKITNEVDNPWKGTGYTSCWDEEYERIMISKISGANPFTLSFTPGDKSWTSFHTPIPNVFFNDRVNSFSVKAGKIYKHNKGDKGVYYNATVNPFYIIVVFNNPEKINKLYYNVNWRTDAILSSGVVKEDITFNKILLWNRKQCSGEQTIVPFDFTQNLEYNYENTNARKLKNMWNFNAFRNLAIDPSAVSVIDGEVVGGNISSVKEFQDKDRLTDNFLAVKLLFSNQKISTLNVDLHLLDVEALFNTIQ